MESIGLQKPELDAALPFARLDARIGRSNPEASGASGESGAKAPHSIAKRFQSPMAQSHNQPILPGPVFADAKHHIKIYQGDCLEILAAVPEGSVVVLGCPRASL